MTKVLIWGDFEQVSKNDFVNFFVKSTFVVLNSQLIDSKLHELSSNLFDACPSLEELNMNGNELSFIPRKLFAKCAQIQKIAVCSRV